MRTKNRMLHRYRYSTPEYKDEKRLELLQDLYELWGLTADEWRELARLEDAQKSKQRVLKLEFLINQK